MKPRSGSSAAEALWPAGASDSRSSASRVSTAGISARSPRCSPRSWRRGFWRRRATHRSSSTHWTTRKLAAHLDVSHMMVARVWRKHGLKPHRIERYMASNDPDFEKKAADIIGLYLNPPAHAAVFCVDEKTHIQALDRKDPVLPLSPGRAERHGFEYFRHGTLSLYAAFNTKTGEVLGKTAERHTSAEFVAFLTDIVVNQPRGKEIHVIADNLSAHKSSARQGLPGCASEGSIALHPNLLVLAQPGRAVVRQDRTRCHRSRRVHFRHRPQDESSCATSATTTSRLGQ